MATKYIDTDLLRKEIERIVKEILYSDNSRYDASNDNSWRNALEDIMNVINTLPEQPKLKPMNIPSAGGGMSTTPPSYKLEVKEQPDGLEEEMDEIWMEFCEDVDYLVYASIARHFAEWGAEHLKK